MTLQIELKRQRRILKIMSRELSLIASQIKHYTKLIDKISKKEQKGK